MTSFQLFLWVIVPYVALTVCVAGHVWRYRYDKFGWTTRSSQIYESRLLRLGSPLFHFGILLVIGGHVVGLLVPEELTSKLGVSESMYHLSAVGLGSVSGLMTVAGLAILIYRRITVKPMHSVTTRRDILTFALLGATILCGFATTLINAGGHPHDYRLTVAPYFRSIFYFQPHVGLMTQAPIEFQLHALLAFTLFAVWPFTRLVHVWSAPVGYLTRPYVVYRSSGRKASVPGSRAPRRGWERVGSGSGARS